MKSTPKWLVAPVALSFFVLAALPADAAPSHQVILELEFSGETCPVDTLVVVGAQSCDGDDIADEIQDELNAADLTGGPFPTICIFSPTQANYQCVWTIPAGCEQVRERATVETGNSCAGSVLTGRVLRPATGSNIGAFIFSIP